MLKCPFDYCYFSFRGESKHGLRVWVTPSMSLEWALYINDNEAGTLLDSTTNILIDEQLSTALSYSNVQLIYGQLLETIPARLLQSHLNKGQ